MALFLWRASEETSMPPDGRRSLFLIIWGLAFVVSVVAELLNAHLGAELGRDRDE